jgi:hypothetical protein
MSISRCEAPQGSLGPEMGVELKNKRFDLYTTVFVMSVRLVRRHCIPPPFCVGRGACNVCDINVIIFVLLFPR